MDLVTGIVIVIALIVIGITVSFVMELKNPQPTKDMGKFDVIDEELTRLHRALATTLIREECDKILAEIARLNEFLTKKEE